MENSEYSLPEEFAEPTTSGAKVNFIKLKKADDKIRIRVLPLPAAQNRKLGDFWGEHYGWSGRNPKDPSKTVFKKYLCIEDRDYQTKMLKVECPACTYRATYESKKEAQKKEIEPKIAKAKEAAKAAGMAPADIEAKAAELRTRLANELEATNKWLKDHNCDRKVRLAVLNEQEQFCILALPYGTWKKLQVEMDKVHKRKYPKTDIQISPAGRKGVWFVITRTGQASRDSDSVEVYEPENADGARMLEFHTYTDEMIKVGKAVLPDLIQMRESLRLPADKISRLVELDRIGGGRSDIDKVDEVFGGAGTVTDSVSVPPPAPDFSAFEAALPKEEPKAPEVAPAAPVAAPVPAPQPAPVAAPVVAPAPTPAPVVSNAMTTAQIDALFEV